VVLLAAVGVLTAVLWTNPIALLVPLFCLLCGPIARVISWGTACYQPSYVTVKARVYSQSCVCSFEGFLGKVFLAGKGLGPFCFIPVTL
jgi:hypothetical protein